VKTYDQFHDGSLEGFWVDDPFVHIFLRTEDKKRFAIVADEVAALGANDFRKGHIILAVETRTHEELSSEDIRLLYDVSEGEAGEKQIQNILQKARAQKLMVLQIDPSYGASFSILARSLELLDRKEWSEKYGSRLAANRFDLIR